MDWTQFIQVLKEVNVIQILIILGGGWVFYNRLDRKIEATRKELKEDFGNRMDKLDVRMDKISEKIGELDKRLCHVEIKIEDFDRRFYRLEGSLASQGHCLFTKSQSDQKAL